MSVSRMQHRNFLSEPQWYLAFGIRIDSPWGLRPWRGAPRQGDFHQGCCLSHQRGRHGPREDRQMNASSLVKAKVGQQISKWFRQTKCSMSWENCPEARKLYHVNLGRNDRLGTGMLSRPDVQGWALWRQTVSGSEGWRWDLAGHAFSGPVDGRAAAWTC